MRSSFSATSISCMTAEVWATWGNIWGNTWSLCTVQHALTETASQFAAKILTPLTVTFGQSKISNQVKYLPSGMWAITAVPTSITVTENVNINSLQRHNHTHCKDMTTHAAGCVSLSDSWQRWRHVWVKVLHSTRHKIGHFRDVLLSQCLGLVLKTQQKQTCICNKIYYNIKQMHKKLKPGLVAFYNLQPGNGTGLILRK